MILVSVLFKDLLKIQKLEFRVRFACHNGASLYFFWYSDTIIQKKS